MSDEIHDLISKATKEMRRRRMLESPQLTLGELIEKLEACEGEEVVFDFASAVPTTLDSWRGSYAELALGFTLTGYDNNDHHSYSRSLSELIEHLKSAIGASYVGWKGGDFIMDANTPVWVSNPGNVGSTAIVDVKDEGSDVILITAYNEY